MNDMSLYQAQEMVSAPKTTNTMMSTRESSMVQAQVFMAKQFPRDENECIARIMRACDRVGLATKATYSYPKGGSKVTGPSIRLAEAIAQAWKNLVFDTVVLEQKEDESVFMAYCWDVETNVRASKTFVVKHKISTKNGMKVLTDPREIYELAANQGARRLRACILSIIPGDVVDTALARCNQTLSNGNKNMPPLIDRLRDISEHLRKYFSVPLASVEKYFGYPLDAFTEMDFQTLVGIYNALCDGSAKREDYFQLPKIADNEGDQQPDSKENVTPKTTNDSKTPKKGEAKQVRISDL